MVLQRLPINERKALFRRFVELSSDLTLSEDSRRAHMSYMRRVLDYLAETKDTDKARRLMSYGNELLHTPQGALAVRLAFDACNDASLAKTFIDTELEEDVIFVYFDKGLGESTEIYIEKFLRKYGDVQPLAIPSDTLFENVLCNLYIFAVTPLTEEDDDEDDDASAQVIPPFMFTDESFLNKCPLTDGQVCQLYSDCFPRLDERAKKAGAVWKRANRSATLTGGNSNLIRKAMLRAIAQKGFIEHNTYRSGGIPEHIRAWEKFVGYGMEKGLLKRK